MKTKLIHTELLRKYHNASDVSIATASHFEFCKFCYSTQKKEYYESLNDYLAYFKIFFFSFVLIITIPFIFLTKGLIMYPFWTLCHIRAQKIIVKKRTAENVNQCAIELLKRLEYSDRDKE